MQLNDEPTILYGSSMESAEVSAGMSGKEVTVFVALGTHRSMSVVIKAKQNKHENLICGVICTCLDIQASGKMSFFRLSRGTRDIKETDTLVLLF